MDRTFSIGQLAERINVPESTIRLWEQRGEIPNAQRVGVARVRVWGESDVSVIETKAAERRQARESRAA